MSAAGARGSTLWLQFAGGSAGLDANFGDLAAASGTRGFRIVESLTWQVGALGSQAQAMWQSDKEGGTGVKTDSSTRRWRCGSEDPDCIRGRHGISSTLKPAFSR